MSLDDRLHQINQSLRLFHEEGSVMLPVGRSMVVKGW
jgi:hypothetical protein